jgi:IS30 family transposase
VPVPRPKHVYDEISVDVVQSKLDGTGSINWLTIATDGKSLYRHAIIHRHKGFAGPELVKLLVHIENQTGRRIKRLRLDNGNEFAELKAYCKSYGIALLLSTAYNSVQNGRTEVSNYIVEKTARTMMITGRVL